MSEKNYTETIEKAVNWWSEKIAGRQPHSNGDNSEASVMACIMADMARKPVSNEQIETFKNVLSEKIMEYMDRYKEVDLSCDYGPGLLLSESAEAAGINQLNFPFKTSMIIKADGRVIVFDGYRASPREL